MNLLPLLTRCNDGDDGLNLLKFASLHEGRLALISLCNVTIFLNKKIGTEKNSFITY